MAREEPGGLGLGHEVHVQAQDQIRLSVIPLQTEPAEDPDGGVEPDEVQVAIALSLEGLLDLRAGPPVGDEGVVGVDGQGLFVRRRRCRRETRNQTKKAEATKYLVTPSHRPLQGWRQENGGGLAENSIPSAGPNRIRFHGLAACKRDQ